MRICCYQHVPFEGPGAIREWAEAQDHSLTCVDVWRTGPRQAVALPKLDDFDLLLVMGGPMNIYHDTEHPWLAAEKASIAAAIQAGKLVLGVCLGAQLIADVLGGPVTKGTHREIGWYLVQLTPAGRECRLFATFPETFTVLHWHGDTFAIPPGAVHVASSEACASQAFATADGRVVGLQFHLEETRRSLALLIDNARHELRDDAAATATRDGGAVPADPVVVDPWVATAEELLAPEAPFAATRKLLFDLLDAMVVQ